jgi:hypothetical protein
VLRKFAEHTILSIVRAMLAQLVIALNSPQLKPQQLDKAVHKTLMISAAAATASPGLVDPSAADLQPILTDEPPPMHLDRSTASINQALHSEIQLDRETNAADGFVHVQAANADADGSLRFSDRTVEEPDAQRQAAHSPSALSAPLMPAAPYGVAAVRELIRFVITLLNPFDHHNTENMRLVGLNVFLTVLEVGPEAVRAHSDLADLYRGDGCKYLVQVCISFKAASFLNTRCSSFASPTNRRMRVSCRSHCAASCCFWTACRRRNTWSTFWNFWWTNYHRRCPHCPSFEMCWKALAESKWKRQH